MIGLKKSIIYRLLKEKKVINTVSPQAPKPDRKKLPIKEDFKN